MPLYIYENVDTGERVEVLQGMNDEHVYEGKEGETWKRVWTVPNGVVKDDPFSAQGFVDRTNTKGSNFGDLWDRSRDMSEKRASQCGGVDPVKEKYYENYSKKRKGAIHPDKLPTSAENKHAKVSLD